MKKYCKCNISLKKVLQYCKSCNKQYFANTLDPSPEVNKVRLVETTPNKEEISEN